MTQKFYVAKWTEEYLHLSGQKPDLQFSDLYQIYQHLIEISKRQEKPCQLNHLISFLVNNYLGFSVKELTDQIARQDANATIEVDGTAARYGHAELLIVDTSDSAKHDEVNRKRNEILRQHNVMRKEMVV